MKAVRPVVSYRKHRQRRVASSQPSHSGRELLTAALTPPQATTLYNGMRRSCCSPLTRPVIRPVVL